ncbi:MAG: Hpt domain-containing protein [Byssovorax sp.]
MSAERDALIREAFVELRQEFAIALPDRVVALATAVRAAATSRDDSALHDEARSGAHKLRGAAGSYGFPAISAAAGRIEEALVEVGAGDGADPAAAWATILEATAAIERASS